MHLHFLQLEFVSDIFKNKYLVFALFKEVVLHGLEDDGRTGNRDKISHAALKGHGQHVEIIPAVTIGFKDQFGNKIT